MKKLVWIGALAVAAMAVLIVVLAGCMDNTNTINLWNDEPETEEAKDAQAADSILP